jgi:serine protease Do
MLSRHFFPTPSHLRALRFTLPLLFACSSAATAQADEASDIAAAKSLSRAFRAVSKRIMSSVVKIRTTKRPRTMHAAPRSASGTTLPDSPFEGFSADPGPDSAPADAPPRQVLGSGVISDASGIIITNYHVVAGGDEVLVELSDGRQFRATEVKTDEQSDLAVVRIKADCGLPAATLGDSDKLEIGDWVVAVGRADAGGTLSSDLDLNVSAGILSGKVRVLPSGRRVDYLQTVAAFSPGNSGGPLVNLDGEVVGISTAIASKSGGNQGVGFAIPVNQVKWGTRQLIEKGMVARAYLGVQIEEIGAEKATDLAIAPGVGVLVAKVFPDTPAAKAGIRKDDRILQFAGREIHSPRQLQEVVEHTEPGSPQTAQIVRDGKPLSLQVVAGSLPRNVGLAGSILREPKPFDGLQLEDLGIRIDNLTKTDSDRFGYGGYQGALITVVEPNGPAGKAGIQAGSLVMQVEKTTVASAAEFKLAMKAHSLSKGVMLLIRTPGGGNRLVQLKPGHQQDRLPPASARPCIGSAMVGRTTTVASPSAPRAFPGRATRAE